MAMGQLSFERTTEEDQTIKRIADRAVDIAKEYGASVGKLTVAMDITTCHANGCPLKLQELLDADDGDFAHDVFGISRHLDRQTGELRDCYLPRFAAVE